MDQTISIIVPVHNAQAYLNKTIKSVLEQTYPEWELILVDDASTDDSAAVCMNYQDGRIRMIRNQGIRGAASARNTGTDAARGRYIAFLDADDVWKPEKLERELGKMKETGSAFVFTSYEYGDEDANGKGKIAHVPETLTYREALKNTIVFTSTVLFDTKMIPKDLIRMPLVESEDTATWWQILKTGIIATGLDEALVIYRRPAKSLSSNKFRAIQRIWKLYRKVEKLSLIKSCYYFTHYAVRTTLRRL